MLVSLEVMMLGGKSKKNELFFPPGLLAYSILALFKIFMLDRYKSPK